MLKSIKYNILIFCHPRSGSSTVRNIVEKLIGGKILFEPFVSKNIKNKENLNHCLEDIMKNDILGIKHAAFARWPFGVDNAEELNKSIIRRFKKIIYLTRKNHFQTALSLEISRQIGSWFTGLKFSDDKFYLQGKILRDIKENPLENVGIIHFRNQFETAKNFNNIYKSFIKNRDHLIISYEDMLENPKNFIKVIANFLNVPINKSAFAFVNPEVKTNSQKTYNLLPNFKELLLEFGGHNQHHFQ